MSVSRLGAITLILLLGISSLARAQDSFPERLQRAEKQFEENRKLTEDLERQNRALLKLLSPATQPEAPGDVSPSAANEVRTLVDAYLKEKEAKQQASDSANSGAAGRYKIGSDLRLSATWKDGLFITTPNQDFSMHLGGWLQYDNVWWDQSANLVRPQGKPGPPPGKSPAIASGVGSGGIGSLEDGTYYRRIRLQANGTFWENYEFNLTLSFADAQFNTIGMDEFWVGATNIPVLGTARIGHVKNAMGLEGNTTASSKTMTFIDSSTYFESIELSQNDVTGIWLGNNYLDQRVTWSATLFRPDNAATSGVLFGNDQWGAQGRLTALPLDEDDNRYLIHLGLSGGWRSGVANNANSPFRSIELRARPELRDDDPAGAGPTVVPNANSNRMVDTGAIVTNSDFLMGTEYLLIFGPFSIQAEYGWNFVQNATGVLNPVTSPFTFVPLRGGPQSYVFGGGYLQFSYLLTGENRSYDKRLGRLDSFYLGRRGNFSKAWLVRDEDGNLNWSLGAWEIAARLSHVDLNDGSGVNRIQGGIMDGVTLGLNWYLSDNLKFQLDYVYDHRYDVPAATFPGSTRGIGLRMQFVY